MKVLYFVNKNGERRELAWSKDRAFLDGAISDFLKAHEYTSFYTREWIKNEETWLDVGSHIEFFVIAKSNVDYKCNCGHDMSFLKKDKIIYCEDCRAIVNTEEVDINDEKIFVCYFCGEFYYYPEDTKSWRLRTCCAACECGECDKNPDECTCEYDLEEDNE